MASHRSGVPVTAFTKVEGNGGRHRGDTPNHRGVTEEHVENLRKINAEIKTLRKGRGN